MNKAVPAIEITNLLLDIMKCMKMMKKEKLKLYKVWQIRTQS